MNKVVMIGRLVRDPELKQTQTGVSVAMFTVAVDRKYKAKDGEKTTDFFDCVAWRSTGEFVSKYFQKGNMIAICGALETRKYQAKDGSNRTAFEINVSEVDFCGEKSAAKPDAERPSYNVPERASTVNDFAVIDDGEDLPF